VLEYCDLGTSRQALLKRLNVAEQQQQQQQQDEGASDVSNGSGRLLGQGPAEAGGGSSGQQDLLQLLVLLHGAAQGLQVLHSSDVVHGDLVSIKTFIL